MRNENEFNAQWGARLRTVAEKSGDYLVLKVAQKYHIGVSDFFIWSPAGVCAAVETKFVLKLPSRNGSVLKHEFQGPQLNFLRRVRKTGAPAVGVVAVHSEKRVYSFDYEKLPAEGNWAADNFRVLMDVVPSFPYDETDIFLHYLFNHGER